MNQILKCLAFALLLLSMTSCGYKYGFGDLSSRYRTIYVPYVEGDHTGSFTTALINELSTSGAFCYSDCGGDAILSIKILDYRDENIGFRYDRNKNNELLNSLIPAETRRTVIAIISLYDSETCCNILGPDKIVASVDFDHEYNSSRDGVNVFSLGQVTDIYGARDASIDPLNRVLAQKIVDYLSSVW